MSSRIYITGLPSSGKSTLARGLATGLGIPHFDLDPIAFVDEAWTPRSADDRDRMISNILREPGWVADGFFVGWTTPLLAAADVIVWLDPPLSRLVLRHVGRHRRSGTRWLAARLRYQVRSYCGRTGGAASFEPALTRAGIESALSPWSGKVMRLRHTPSVSDIVEATRSRRRDPDARG